MTVHISFFSDMLEQQLKDTQLLLVIKFRPRKRKVLASHFYIHNDLVSVRVDIW
jgi:hypothetical protein